MARQLPEWIGKDDDTPFPPRVKLRVYERQNGICAVCTRPLVHWDCDHTIAIINGGENRESNARAVCVRPCHSRKTAEDLAEKSAVYKRKARHVGIKKRKHLIPGSKGTRWKKKISGEVVER